MKTRAQQLVQRLPQTPALVAALAAVLTADCFLLPTVASATALLQEEEASTEAAPTEELTNERLLEAWSYLLPKEQSDIIEWYKVDTEYLETAQMDFLRYAVSLLEMDAGLLPSPEPAPHFDPQTHAPGQPIARRQLGEDDKRAAEARDSFFELIPKRNMTPGYRYNWGTGQVEQLANVDSLERIFKNGLAGYPPQLDLAEAAILMALDDGSLRTAHRAFDHSYTDRDGRVFPGVSLYDAWSSGKQMEMPDVDTLGIVHTVLDEWKKWKAPVLSSSDQEDLYAAVGEVYSQVHRFRGLRKALARTYLSGVPVMRDNYQETVVAMHHLWETFSADPEALRGELPDADDWKKFLGKQQKEAFKKKNLPAAEVRRDTLAGDAWYARNSLVQVMKAYGALDRTERPEPEPEPEPTPESGTDGTK